MEICRNLITLLRCRGARFRFDAASLGEEAAPPSRDGTGVEALPERFPMRSALSRTGLLLLALTLASPPLHAQEHRADPGFFTALWEKLGSIMDPDGLTASGCSDRGSGMDPNGCPTSPTTASGSDRGSGMDPDGRD